jgi:hypothetical protein
MEIVLADILSIQEDGRKSFLLRVGHYHVTNSDHYQSRFAGKCSCSYMVIYFSPGLISNDGPGRVAEVFGCWTPRVLKSTMNDMVIGLLKNSYKENLQSFFFDNCVSEILFKHLAVDNVDIPEGLSPKQYSAVIAADNIIAVDLGKHHSISSLSRQVGINEYILK